MADRTVTREEIYGILSQWLQAITQGVSEVLEIQETEDEGRIAAYTSVITSIEVRVAPFRAHQEELVERY